ncbi:type I-E CRISPR-associated protein Cse2/CasB [Streptomyces reniochalinae]|uniref:Type I-E CRISPR-associated protein Cse2/CasB n=1 Tax=Streptomyces reniochalinae TaxID=2250578 RepID=A0A367F2B6_9ACTN|nr:type I-E CRISPR-associated protein Cse2/CasB [Streptomyces reniochalinae]RCG23925.1 type I-E CRISPR-associated protein Cse2/CasB [Streptomyces reniochalinae]
MSDTDHRAQRIWNKYIAADGTWRRKESTAAEKRPPGEELAILRRGLSRPAGTVLPMFAFYTCPVDDFAARRGEVSAEQEAEHAALALFGLHQQSKERPMHRGGVSLGRAMRALRHHDRSSPEAVDSRFEQAFSATGPETLQFRLRGLVTQLKGIDQPLDYDRLAEDLYAWRRPHSRSRVRRRWGLDYYGWTQDRTGKAGPAAAPTTAPS